MSEVGRGTAFARAALAGNPSDMYGGRTLAMVLRCFAASATARFAERDELGPPGEGGEQLLAGALERFRRAFGVREPVALGCTTSVPREVGLGGSSAIVIACTRALCALHRREFEPDELAAHALAVELDLGIAAGLQDRIVQAREALVAMNFGSEGRPLCEELDESLLPALVVAWHPEAAGPSGVAHAPLRERHSRGDPEVVNAIERLTTAAARAREALVDGDLKQFAECVDASYDERCRLMPVHTRVREMVDAVRNAGGSANSAGSGGAIVGTQPVKDGWRERLEAGGARVIVLDPVSSRPDEILYPRS
jgi:glucuronokinase